MLISTTTACHHHRSSVPLLVTTPLLLVTTTVACHHPHCCLSPPSLPLVTSAFCHQLPPLFTPTVRGRASKSRPTLVLGLVVLWAAPSLHSSASPPTLLLSCDSTWKMIDGKYPELKSGYNGYMSEVQNLRFDRTLASMYVLCRPSP